MRKNRLAEIKKILSQDYINSQDLLSAKLSDCGYNITQATLSRDLAYLKVSKSFVAGKGYVYILPEDIKRLGEKPLPDSGAFLGVISIKFSRNIVVFNTISGYATHICVTIDNAKIPEALGTVAGDDTIIAVFDEDVSKESIKNILINNFPELADRI
jgi:transcriptional regulator of arginine metabolism